MEDTTHIMNDQLNLEQIQKLDVENVIGTYSRQPILFVRGEGSRLWDSNGKEYLDFLSGISVVQVGHCHPKVAQAIANQAKTLMHVSNLFHNPLQARLAARLNAFTGMDKVFFCNSGAEANECALKIARKWGKSKRGLDCFEIITFQGSFHGRTMGTVSATAQSKYQTPFEPLVPGFIYAPLNDLSALDELITERTCAVMIEPIQGESGVKPASPEFLQGVRALCNEADVLLILDEVQCGMGRTGKFLASQRADVTGDIVTLAKGIADGFPMGVCLARGEAATVLVPGDHGSTFAGQPLACAASMATLDVLEEEHLLENATLLGAYLKEQLQVIQRDYTEQITEIRGYGLMIGIELAKNNARQLMQALFQAGVVTNAVGDSIIRLLPPLNISTSDCDHFLEAFQMVLAQ